MVELVVSSQAHGSDNDLMGFSGVSLGCHSDKFDA
jgi:hypothetical protein